MTTLVSMTRRGLDRLTLWGLIFGWLAFLVVLPLAPASWWYSLDRVTVLSELGADGTELMEVDRSIRWNFDGDWRVEEQLLTNSGGWTTVQVCQGHSRYRTDKSLPDQVTLGWWKGSDCKFEGRITALFPGTYRVCTWVKWQPNWFPMKYVENCSEPFERRTTAMLSFQSP